MGDQAWDDEKEATPSCTVLPHFRPTLELGREGFAILPMLLCPEVLVPPSPDAPGVRSPQPCWTPAGFLPASCVALCSGFHFLCSCFVVPSRVHLAPFFENDLVNY